QCISAEDGRRAVGQADAGRLSRAFFGIRADLLLRAVREPRAFADADDARRLGAYAARHRCNARGRRASDRRTRLFGVSLVAMSVEDDVQASVSDRREKAGQLRAFPLSRECIPASYGA